MNFDGPIIYPERADFAKDLFDDGLVSNARATHYLHAAISDPHQCFGHGNFSHRTLNRSERA